MKEKTKPESLRAERRRFVGLISGLGAAGLALPFLPARMKQSERDLKEADFYRSHDLAG